MFTAEQARSRGRADRVIAPQAADSLGVAIVLGRRRFSGATKSLVRNGDLARAGTVADRRVPLDPTAAGLGEADGAEGHRRACARRIGEVAGLAWPHAVRVAADAVDAAAREALAWSGAGVTLALGAGPGPADAAGAGVAAEAAVGRVAEQRYAAAGAGRPPVAAGAAAVHRWAAARFADATAAAAGVLPGGAGGHAAAHADRSSGEGDEAAEEAAPGAATGHRARERIKSRAVHASPLHPWSRSFMASVAEQ